MRVAFISNGYFPTHYGGGSFISTRLIVDRLRELGHEVDVFTTSGERDELVQRAADHFELPDGTSSILPRRVGKSLGIVRHAGDFSSYDLVHVYGLGTAPGVVLRSSVPVVGTVNNLEWVCINWVEYLRSGCPEYDLREAVTLARQSGHGPATLPFKLGLEYVGKRLARRVDHVTVQTTGMKHILTRCGYDDRQISVVPNLLDPRFCCEGAEDTNTVISVGRLEEKKGADDLVAAFRDLPPDLRDRFSLRLYGSGPLEDSIRRTAAELDADIEIGFVPYEELPAVYRDAALMVQGSKYPEPFSRTWMEAMASETPIVVSENPSSRSVLGGVAAFYDPFDPRTLRRTLAEVLRDADRRVEMARRGKTSASRFDPDDVVARYDTVYDRVIE